MYVGTNKIGEIPQNTHKNTDGVVYITHNYTLIYYHINYLALNWGTH
jgi:hypothetical protein